MLMYSVLNHGHILLDLHIKFGPKARGPRLGEVIEKVSFINGIREGEVAA